MCGSQTADSQGEKGLATGPSQVRGGTGVPKKVFFTKRTHFWIYELRGRRRRFASLQEARVQAKRVAATGLADTVALRGGLATWPSRGPGIKALFGCP